METKTLEYRIPRMKSVDADMVNAFKLMAWLGGTVHNPGNAVLEEYEPVFIKEAAPCLEALDNFIGVKLHLRIPMDLTRQLQTCGVKMNIYASIPKGTLGPDRFYMVRPTDGTIYKLNRLWENGDIHLYAMLLPGCTYQNVTLTMDVSVVKQLFDVEQYNPNYEMQTLLDDLKYYFNGHPDIFGDQGYNLVAEAGL